MTQQLPATTASTADTREIIMSVAARLTRLYARVLGQLDTPLTFRQHRLLARVREGHTSLATLATFGNLTLPTISESVDVLVRRGLLTRETHPSDRRAIVMALTPPGTAAVRAGDEALAVVGDRLLENVPEADRSALHDALEAVFASATRYFREDDGAEAPAPTEPAAPRSRPGRKRTARSGP